MTWSSGTIGFGSFWKRHGLNQMVVMRGDPSLSSDFDFDAGALLRKRFEIGSKAPRTFSLPRTQIFSRPTSSALVSRSPFSSVLNGMRNLSNSPPRSAIAYRIRLVFPDPHRPSIAMANGAWALTTI